MSIESTGGSAPLTPLQRQMYEREYREGAQLFQKAVQHYAKSDNPFQKKEFQKVMEKSLEVLNETARGLNRQALLEQNAKIAKDFASFNSSPDDAKTVEQLNKDLDDAQKSV